MKKYRIRVGLDVDDTLYECNSYAVSIINSRHPDEEPLKVEDIKAWGGGHRHADERIALYNDPEFVRTQPITDGAQEFVKKLSEIADVFFITAVPACCMSARAERLIADFPEIPAENMLLGRRKDIIALDIMLDDGAHNISSSRAAYPVLFRKPWNADLSGLLSVNSYDDFLHFCEMVRNSFSEKFPTLADGGVLCLVGPSGSSKTEIANSLTALEGFEKPLTSTTRPHRKSEGEESYRFISERQFIKEKNEGRYIETTVYSGYHFGTSAKEIDPIVERGSVAVIPIDICGAITIKNLYRQRAMLVFTRRERADAIKSIIERDIDIDDKTRRIMSLDFEYRNSEVCDIEVNVGDDVDAAVNKIVELVKRR
ncbi:MAG: hypothetical protein J1G07_02780 [Clostridiales bacterium]|nr:hypothetical protein [Clostridiales bacterium]